MHEVVALHERYPDRRLWMTEVCQLKYGAPTIPLPATILKTETSGEIKSSQIWEPAFPAANDNFKRRLAVTSSRSNWTVSGLITRPGFGSTNRFEEVNVILSKTRVAKAIMVATTTTAIAACASLTRAASEAQYKIKFERNVRVRMRDGVELAAVVVRPDAEGKFPAIMWYFPYKFLPMIEPAYSERDDNLLFEGQVFFAEHGYASVSYDVRGTGESGGSTQDMYSDQERQDGYDLNPARSSGVEVRFWPFLSSRTGNSATLSLTSLLVR
jgi:hypothetical protein